MSILLTQLNSKKIAANFTHQAFAKVITQKLNREQLLRLEQVFNDVVVIRPPSREEMRINFDGLGGALQLEFASHGRLDFDVSLVGGSARYVAIAAAPFEGREIHIFLKKRKDFNKFRTHLASVLKIFLPQENYNTDIILSEYASEKYKEERSATDSSVISASIAFGRNKDKIRIKAICNPDHIFSDKERSEYRISFKKCALYCLDDEWTNKHGLLNRQIVPISEEAGKKSSSSPYQSLIEELTPIEFKAKEICQRGNKKIFEDRIFRALEKAGEENLLSVFLELGQMALRGHKFGLFSPEQKKMLQDLCVVTIGREMSTEKSCSEHIIAISNFILSIQGCLNEGDFPSDLELAAVRASFGPRLTETIAPSEHTAARIFVICLGRIDVSSLTQKERLEVLRFINKIKTFTLRDRDTPRIIKDIEPRILDSLYNEVEKQIKNKEYDSALNEFAQLLLPAHANSRRASAIFNLLLSDLKRFSSPQLKQMGELAARMVVLSPSFTTRQLQSILELAHQIIFQNKEASYDLLNSLKNHSAIKNYFFKQIADLLFRKEKDSLERSNIICEVMTKLMPAEEGVIKLRQVLKGPISREQFVEFLKLLNYLEPEEAHKIFQAYVGVHLYETVGVWNNISRKINHSRKEKGNELPPPCETDQLTNLFTQLHKLIEESANQERVGEIGQKIMNQWRTSTRRSWFSTTPWIQAIRGLLSKNQLSYFHLARELFHTSVGILSAKEQQSLALVFLTRSHALSALPLGKEYLEIALTGHDIKTTHEVMKYIQNCLKSACLERPILLSSLLSLMNTISIGASREAEFKKEWQQHVEPFFISLLSQFIGEGHINEALQLLTRCEGQLLEEMTGEGKERLLKIITSIRENSIVTWAWYHRTRLSIPRIDVEGILAVHAWSVWKAEPVRHIEVIAKGIGDTFHPVCYRIFLEALHQQTDPKYFAMIKRMAATSLSPHQTQAYSQMTLGYRRLFEYVSVITVGEADDATKKANVKFLQEQWNIASAHAFASKTQQALRSEAIDILLKTFIGSREISGLHSAIRLMNQENFNCKHVHEHALRIIDLAAELAKKEGSLCMDSKSLSQFLNRLIAPGPESLPERDIGRLRPLFVQMLSQQHSYPQTVYNCLELGIDTFLKTFNAVELTELLASLLDRFEQLQSYGNLKKVNSLANRCRINLSSQLARKLKPITESIIFFTEQLEAKRCDPAQLSNILVIVKEVVPLYVSYETSKLRTIKGLCMGALQENANNCPDVHGIVHQLMSCDNQKAIKDLDLVSLRDNIYRTAQQLNIHVIIIEQTELFDTASVYKSIWDSISFMTSTLALEAIQNKGKVAQAAYTKLQQFYEAIFNATFVPGDIELQQLLAFRMMLTLLCCLRRSSETAIHYGGMALTDAFKNQTKLGADEFISKLRKRLNNSEAKAIFKLVLIFYLRFRRSLSLPGSLNDEVMCQELINITANNAFPSPARTEFLRLIENVRVHNVWAKDLGL